MWHKLFDSLLRLICMQAFIDISYYYLLLQLFYGSLDFVRDYLDEPTPEK